MSWSILQNVPNPHIDANGDPYSGAVLKAYLPGTTTSTSIAIDSSGTSPQTSITFNAEGKLEVSGSEIQPYIDRKCKWGIFANSTDAASNTPFQMGPFDNVEVLSGSTTVVPFDVLNDAVISTSISDGDALNIKERTSGNGGGAMWDVVLSSTVTENTSNIVQCTGVATLSLVLRVGSKAVLKQFGGTGDGSTDDTAFAGLWLDYLIANNVEGDSGNAGDIYLVDYIDKAANSGLKISGGGTFKATGSNRLGMIRLTGVRGLVDLDGITIDGNDIAARPLEIQNTGSALFGDVYISPTVKIINAKNNTPDTNTASAIYVFGNFDSVIFAGEIDGVDSTTTSGSVSIGLFVSWSTTYFVRNTVVTSTARIKNVKNSNTVTADADGVQCLAPTDEYASFTVESGALFEECEGRAIKSQVVGNAIGQAIIRRSLYDGIIEINLQYGGGSIVAPKIFHDGYSCTTAIIGVTQRLLPLTHQCSVIAPELHVTGSPATDTPIMVSTDVNDATVALRGFTVRDAKVFGAVDTMVACTVANVADVNHIKVFGCWAETINTAFITGGLFGSSRGQLGITARDNSCENGCTGLSIPGSYDVKVIADNSNENITPILSTPFSYTVATGVLTPTGGEKTIRVVGEGGAADDIVTITNVNYSPDDLLTLYNNTGNTLTYKDGSDNLKLAGDAALSSINDSLVLRFNGTNWCEISRSINGA